MIAATHTRTDGRTVTLREAWHVELRDADGRLVEPPLDWIAEHGHAARLIYARKCVEPVALDAGLVADVRGIAARVRLKRGEREGIELAIAEGRPTLLRNIVREFSTRVGGEGAKALVKRITAAQNAAVAAFEAHAPASEQPRGDAGGEATATPSRGCSGAGALDHTGTREGGGSPHGGSVAGVPPTLAPTAVLSAAGRTGETR